MNDTVVLTCVQKQEILEHDGSHVFRIELNVVERGQPGGFAFNTHLQSVRFQSEDPSIADRYHVGGKYRLTITPEGA